VSKRDEANILERFLWKGGERGEEKKEKKKKKEDRKDVIESHPIPDRHARREKKKGRVSLLLSVEKQRRLFFRRGKRRRTGERAPPNLLPWRGKRCLDLKRGSAFVREAEKARRHLLRTSKPRRERGGKNPEIELITRGE